MMTTVFLISTLLGQWKMRVCLLQICNEEARMTIMTLQLISLHNGSEQSDSI